MNFENFPKQENNNWSLNENQRVFVKRSSGDIEGDWTVSQINNEIITVFKKNPDNLEENLIKRISLSDLEKINNKEAINFTEADNFDDLFKLIDLKGGIKGGAQEYSPETLKEIINKVRNNEIELKYVTRTNDLRLAVEKLINKESKD